MDAEGEEGGQGGKDRDVAEREPEADRGRRLPLAGLVSGRWLNIVVAWTPRRRRAAWLVLQLLFAALQVRQQRRADLLFAGT